MLTFPGNNCETETVRALKTQGFQSEVFLWNREPNELKNFDGVVIPGGFSFEDRGRSGIVSSQEPIFSTLHEMANAGTPILGICNGAQMLVESGLILSDGNTIPTLALLDNKRTNEAGEILGTGFYHSYRTLKPVNTKTPFSNFSENIHIPIAHGEGRFTFTPEMEKEVLSKNLIVFTYVNEKGEADTHYPTNPNGSFQNAAAICNPQGNVVALMPHPERNKNGNPVFVSLWNYFQNKETVELNNETLSVTDFENIVPQKINKNEIVVLVRLKISDKTEKTFINVLDEDNIKRREKWGFYIDSTASTEEKIKTISRVISSGELVNLNKQWVVAKIDGEWYDWTDSHTFEKSDARFIEENCFIVEAKEDFKGQEKQQHLSHVLADANIQNIKYGVCWEVPASKVTEYISHPLFSSRVGDTITIF